MKIVGVADAIGSGKSAFSHALAHELNASSVSFGDLVRSWANEYFDAQAVAISLEQLRRSDAMPMGRNTYEMFAAAWPASSGDYADPRRLFEATR